MKNNFFSSFFLILEKFPLIKNTLLVASSKIIQSIISFIFIILISRELGAEGLGEYSFIFSFSSLFFVFSEMGLNSFIIKKFSQSKLNKNILSNILTIRLSVFILIFFIFLLITAFFFSHLLILFLIISFFHLLRDLKNFFNSVNRSQNNSILFSFGDIFERIIFIIFIFLSLNYNLFNLYVILIISIFSLFLQNIILFNKYKDYINIFRKINFFIFKKYFYIGLPYLFFGFSIVSLNYIDQIFIYLFSGASYVGFYSSSYKIIEMVNIISAIIISFGFTSFNKLSNNKKTKKLLIEILFFLLFSLSIILIVLGLFFGKFLLNLIYGFDSQESILSFKILLYAIPFMVLTQIQIFYLSSNNSEKFINLVLFLSIILNSILNIILIPIFSLYGAAFSTVFSYLFLFLLFNYKIEISFKNYILFLILICLLTLHKIINIYILTSAILIIIISLFRIFVLYFKKLKFILF